MDSGHILAMSERRSGTIPTTAFLGIFIALNILIMLFFDRYVMTKELYYNILSIRLDDRRIDEIIALSNKVLAMKYFVFPLISIMKIVIISSLLQLPLLLMNKNINYKIIVRIVILANFIFIAMALVKLGMIFSAPVEELTLDTMSINPLSILSCVNPSQYSSTACSLLNTLNCFELAWIGFLWFGLKNEVRLASIDIGISIGFMWTILLIGQTVVIYFVTQML